MDYMGEHLLPGRLGHFFIVLALVSSLFATFSYFQSARGSIHYESASGWKKLARWFFLVQTISVFAVFIILFYIIHNHLFEYKYAWQHSSRSLELKYLLASFWEGQEGSFLLWSIWNSILGVILIRTAGKWESPVMTIMSLAQFCLATMVSGLYFFDWKLGSNPFLLLRDSGILDNTSALHINFDVTQPLRPDYMSSITDGNDLNPLLQNKWMVIHPPVLFLGFASTIVPFAFALSSLWKKDYSNWVKPVLPWALLSAATLGAGIMLGAWWAYESLTFGGYWAWDPVENASLVPWLILIAGIHTLLIFKKTGYSLRSAYLFLILTFIFILYSTFLTRTGVLGESSVHAFTGEGQNLIYHMLVFLALFIIPAFVLFFRRYRETAARKDEEKTSSREFWMFIGSLVLFLSAMVIIGKTSLPVINLILGTNLAPPEDAEFAYNNIQVYVAIIVALLSAGTQYLKYKDTGINFFSKKLLLPFLVAVAASWLMFAIAYINYTKKGPVFQASIQIAAACSLFAIIANAGYIWIGLKGKLKFSGGSVAHAGFGMVLLGILISSSGKQVLSNNLNGIPAPLAEGENPMENLTLVQGLTVDMGNYSLTYEGDSAHPRKEMWYYKVRFRSKDGKEEFVLKPNAFVNYKGNEGLLANPASKHYWDHDVFTYITSLPNPDQAQDTASFKTHSITPGDTVFYSGGYLIYQDTKLRDSLPEELFGKEGKLFEAQVKVFSKTGSVYSTAPKLAFAKGEFLSVPDTVTAESLVLQLQKVQEGNRIEFGVKESGAVMKYITLKAFKFPFINLLWAGVFITTMGILLSMLQRMGRLKKLELQKDQS